MTTMKSVSFQTLLTTIRERFLMNFTKKTIGAVALALALCACCFLSTSNAQDEKAGVAKSGEKLDFSLFDVPDGKDATFYKERLQAIQENLSRYQPTEEEIAKIRELIPDAYLTITKNLSASEEIEEAERESYYQVYTALLAQKGNFDELNALLNAEKAKDEPNETRVAMLETILLSAKIEKAGEAKDEAALKALAAELVEKALTIDAIAANSQRFCDAISLYDEELGKTTFKKIFASFENSDNPLRKRLAESFLGKERFNNLVGNDVLVEGLFLDGEEIKWDEYRGKVVLIDFWATWCGPCLGEIPNVRALYEKYHDAGFEVVGYSVDDDLDALHEFEEERKLPWKTMSEKMSTDKKDDKGEPVYKNLSAYYGVNAIPTMILVGKDGKAIDTNARGEHLKELLEKQFPDVK